MKRYIHAVVPPFIITRVERKIKIKDNPLYQLHLAEHRSEQRYLEEAKESELKISKRFNRHGTG